MPHRSTVRRAPSPWSHLAPFATTRLHRSSSWQSVFGPAWRPASEHPASSQIASRPAVTSSCSVWTQSGRGGRARRARDAACRPQRATGRVVAGCRDGCDRSTGDAPGLIGWLAPRRHPVSIVSNRWQPGGRNHGRPARVLSRSHAMPAAPGPQPSGRKPSPPRHRRSRPVAIHDRTLATAVPSPRSRRQRVSITQR